LAEMVPTCTAAHQVTQRHARRAHIVGESEQGKAWCAAVAPAGQRYSTACPLHFPLPPDQIAPHKHSKH
jgi:hypothetical protein